MIRKTIQTILTTIVILMLICGCGGGSNIGTNTNVSTNTNNASNQVHTLVEINPGRQMQESYSITETGTGVDKSAVGPFNIAQTALYNNWITAGNIPFIILIERNPTSNVISINTTIGQNNQTLNSIFSYSANSTQNSVKFNNYTVGSELAALITQPSSSSYFDRTNVDNNIIAWMNQNGSTKLEIKGLIKTIPGKTQEPHKIWYTTEITEGKLNNAPFTAAQLSNNFSIGELMRSLLNSFIAVPLFVSLN